MKLKRRDFVKLAGLMALLSAVPATRMLSSKLGEAILKGDGGTGPLLEYKFTFCSMCGALCGLRVGFKDGKPIVVSNVLGHPQTGLCGRAATLVYFNDHPLRLKKPLKRVGARGEGRLAEVDWDTALNEIAGKLREIVSKYGFKAIAITNHDVWSYYIPIFRYLFGTPNTIDHGSMCWGNGTVARGHTLGISHHRFVDPDYENASYILLVGRTISTSSMGVVHRLTSNEKVRVVVVDPRLPEIGFGDVEWVPIIPATDAALLYSMIHVIIEEGLFDADFLKRFTNAPFLIKPDGRPLVEADVVAGGRSGVFLVFDARTGRLEDHTRAADPHLTYVGRVTLADGREIEVKTAFVLLRERAAKYPPEEAEKITGVPASTIRRIAREFALYRGVADDTWYVAKNGVEYDVVRLVLILNALVGNLDKPGGLCFREDQRFPSAIREITVEGRRVAETVYGARMPAELFGDLAVTRVDRAKYRETPTTFDAVLDAIINEDPYPIKALFVIGTSPMARDMDTEKVKKAYEKLELLVVIDVMPIDDVDYADYVLPDTTFLERGEIADVKWTLHAATHVQNQLLEPPEGYDVRDALWIMFEIARRAFPERARALGWKDEYADYKRYQEEFLELFDEALLRTLAANWRMSVDDLKKVLEENGFILFKRKEYGVRPYRTALPTRSGKVEIYSIRALEVGMDPLPDLRKPNYTLPQRENEFYLVNGKSPLVSVHAALMEPMKYLIDRRVWMNPKDAERLGIKDGDLIELEGLDTGAKAVARVRVTERVRERVLFVYAQVAGRTSKLLPKDHFAREGVNPNYFCVARPTPIAGGGATNASVRVRKL